MSYFDSRVGNCPVWQVEFIWVVKRPEMVGISGIVRGVKMWNFSVED
ncbi:hypothetical protein LWHH1689_1654 [Limosilactobacillus reuteri]|uniref:Uncharacterized protein n=1 Tax=Limosilactobacillus reuteri TaxID=1598 RepID=A0A2S1ESS5_LIMRT|nr:hypothetical protein LWHH1689_1654 [Limosilactobacillus reuteri]